MESRPKLKIQLSATDKIIETAGWLILLSQWVFTVWSYSKMPDIILVHSNGAGEPNDYGSKSTIILLPVIATVIFCAMTLIIRYPHIFNYPVKLTEENIVKQYTIATRLIRVLKTSLVIIFSFTVLLTWCTANNKNAGLGIWFLPLTTLFIFLPLGYFISKMIKMK